MAIPTHDGLPVTETYNVAQAAAILGVSPWLYYEQFRAGVVPGRKIGRRVVVPRHHLHQYLETGQWG